MNARAPQTWLRLTVAIVSLTLIGYLGRHYLGDLDRLEQVYVPLLPVILLLYFAARSVTSEIMRFNLGRLGYRIDRLESFMLTMLVSYTNLAIPRAGYGPAALYLKRTYRVPLADFTSILLPVVALQVPCIGLLGLICQLMLSRQEGIAYDPISSLVFGTCLAAGAALPALGLPVSSRFRGRIARFLRRFSDSWRQIASNPRTLCAVVAAQFLVLLLRALRLNVAFAALEQDPPFWGVCVASLLADVVFLLSITPSALGLREAVIAYSSEAMGVPPSMALAVTLLDRLTWVLGVVVVGQVSLWKLRGRSDSGQGEQVGS